MSKKLFIEYPEQDERKYYDLLVEQAKIRMDDLYKGEERALRDTHAKSHAGIKGILEIFDFDQEAIKRELNQRTSLTASQLNTIFIKQGLLARPKHYQGSVQVAPTTSQAVLSAPQDYLPDSEEFANRTILERFSLCFGS